ncbi:unnamed protein product [Prunus brigantina]
MVAPPPINTVPPIGLAVETTTPATAVAMSTQGPVAESSHVHGGTSHQGGLITITNLDMILEQLQAFSPLPPRSTHAHAMDERADRQLDGYQGNVHQRLGSQGYQPDNHLNQDREERHSAVHLQRSIHERLGPQGGQLDNPQNEDHEERLSVAHFRRVDSHLKTGRNFEDAPRKEMDQENSRPFTVEIEQATPSKRLSTPSFTHFKGDFDPESHLKHFKSVLILYKANDVLMCKVFAMTLGGAAQDWFHTLPSGSISSFKELAYVFTKEYISYRTIKKNPDHLYNLRKKSDESLRDYMKRFKAEKANIVGCDD